MENISLVDYENLMHIIDTISADGYIYILSGYDPVYRDLVMESAITKDQFENLYMFIDENSARINYINGNESYKLNIEKIKLKGNLSAISMPEQITDLLWYIEKIKSV